MHWNKISEISTSESDPNRSTSSSSSFAGAAGVAGLAGQTATNGSDILIELTCDNKPSTSFLNSLTSEYWFLF